VEVQRKIADWLRTGVKLLWYVNPETGCTTVYHRDQVSDFGPDEDLTGEDVIPGLRLRIQDVHDELAEVIGPEEGTDDQAQP